MSSVLRETTPMRTGASFAPRSAAKPFAARRTDKPATIVTQDARRCIVLSRFKIVYNTTMKVVLVQPPVEDFYDTDVRLQPIGLCYMKAAVKKWLPDIDVVVRDYHAGLGRRTVAVPRALRYLEAYYPVADRSPFSTFHRYYHFGASFDDIEADLAALNPDLVAISLFTPYYREALEVACRAKRR